MTATQRSLDADGLARVIDYARSRRRLPPPEIRAALRKAAGVSLRQLAGALGVSPSAVAFWETGRRVPNREHLDGYMAALMEMTRASGFDEEAQR